MSNNNIKNIDKLAKKLALLGGNVEETFKRSINNQCRKIQAEAKLLCPGDTGDLRESIKKRVQVANGHVEGIVYTNKEYAAYVEFGTGRVGEMTPVADKYPGALSYKQDKWLTNIPDVGIRWVQGQPAQPYLYPALKNNEDRVLENIKQDLESEIREVARR